MKKLISYIISGAAFLSSVSCGSDNDVVGGTINSTEPLDITTSELLSQMDETGVVGELFERAGLTDEINGDVTVIAPNKWSVNRYLRRKNSPNHKAPDAAEFTLESMDAAELSKMGMYIFPGQWWRGTIPEEGVYLTSIDGSQEILLTLDPTYSDPGAAHDGGGVAGAGYQYSNFMMSVPYVIHALFKRGDNWELTHLERTNLGFDSAECDQYYRMYVSDIRTSTGVVHVLYMGDKQFNEHYYYHTLFLFGTRSDDV